MRVSTYKINIDDERVDDLQRRLRSTRWPTALDADSWEDGTSLAFLKELLAYWKDHFDWRAQEARLNMLPQFIAEIDDLSIHFVHQRGNGPSPLPLILTHGWPGSFFEMEGIIPMLADPAAHGADPADAFDVVVPSLPGYGFSQAPGSAGIGPYEISGLWLKLMQGLGYETFCLQGGDIGAAVSSWLAYRFPQNTTALHLNYIPGSYRPPLGAGQAPISTEEQAFLDHAAQWADSEGAYAHMQGTKPQTLAYALTDSPIGLAAWISEKFQAWSDGDIRTTFSLDALLIEISIYWFSGTLDSSLRLYKESRKRPMHFKANERVLPPLGLAHFARELPLPPRSWVERVYDVRRWTEMPKGGHFAAMERPELLAEDIRAYFRPFRTR
ncbi:epoxide hydrolase [Rhizobium leguminosarum]|uniref:epoxide hydrolase family protein n=1 Tax=Rhizobium leguminosarum TaxID=384 RepID=UPI001C96CEB1|nr:epoxide hydrolase family protein [Rhizobium leguminosarum]MBY5333470.1 epoxide hydrolase [Rhizobium leguminosarum]